MAEQVLGTDVAETHIADSRTCVVDLVKSVLRIDFKEAFRPWLDLRSFLRVIGENPTVELQGQPIVVDRGAKKERIVLEVRGLRIEQEASSSLSDSTSKAISLLKSVNETLGLPTIASLRYDAMFIEQYPLPFHELVAVFKDRFFRQNPLTETSTDVGLSLDQHEGDITRHTQIGPMEPEQLQLVYLVWPRQHMPSQFAFLSLGVSQKREFPYGEGVVQEFLRNAGDWQTNQAQIILASLHS